MNRRQFTQRLAALAATPALPAGLATKALASAAPVATKIANTSSLYYKASKT